MYWFYLRVSTKSQSFFSQEQMIKNYCVKYNIEYKEENTFKDFGISGLKNWKDRKINDIIMNAKNGDIIISSERSRLSRDYEQDKEISNICNQKGIIIKTIIDEEIINKIFFKAQLDILKNIIEDNEYEIKDEKIHNNKIRCDTCNKDISKGNIQKHNKCEKHLLRLKQKNIT